MLQRSTLCRMCLVIVLLASGTYGKAEPLVLEKISDHQQASFQISYRNLPLVLSLPTLQDINKPGAVMKMGLGKIKYCNEFLALNNPLNSTLAIAVGSLNFRIPETVAKIDFSIGQTQFKNDLQVIKEVCDYEGEEYALYHLKSEKGFVSELPITEALLKQLQTAAGGTLEVKYSSKKGVRLRRGAAMGCQ